MKERTTAMDNKNIAPETEAYLALSKAINSTCFSKRKFVEQFTRDHRYLQGEVFQLCLEIINMCASNEYGYDDRNAFCHIIAKEIIQKVPQIKN